MDFRHEWKHEINASDMIAVRQRLRAVARPDAYAVNGAYEIRSLYFDNLADKALREKIDGVNRREKFRLRYYNGNNSEIYLEKKSKLNGLGSKKKVLITKEEVQSILDGKYDFMMEGNRELLKELYCKMMHQGLRPKTIVDYTREPYVYEPGNVRVTLDYNIRTGLGSTDFLNPNCITVGAGKSVIVMEVKWDSFLPAIIRDVIQLAGRQTTAFSKYAICRTYG